MCYLLQKALRLIGCVECSWFECRFLHPGFPRMGGTHGYRVGDTWKAKHEGQEPRQGTMSRAAKIVTGMQE